MAKEDLIRRIRASLAYTGMHQDELAYRLGISQATMSRKMNNPERFTWGEILKISKLFCWKISME